MKRWITFFSGICMIVISAGAAVSFLSKTMVPAAAYTGWVIAGLGVTGIVTGVRAPTAISRFGSIRSPNSSPAAFIDTRAIRFTSVDY